MRRRTPPQLGELESLPTRSVVGLPITRFTRCDSTLSSSGNVVRDAGEARAVEDVLEHRRSQHHREREDPLDESHKFRVSLSGDPGAFGDVREAGAVCDGWRLRRQATELSLHPGPFRKAGFKSGVRSRGHGAHAVSTSASFVPLASFSPASLFHVMSVFASSPSSSIAFLTRVPPTRRASLRVLSACASDSRC